MSARQYQMASVPIEHSSLFKPLMWNDSIDTSFWRKPLVEGNYVQHLSLLVDFFHLIYSSFILYVRRRKQSQIKHIYGTKLQGSHKCAWNGKIWPQCALKGSDEFSHTLCTGRRVGAAAFRAWCLRKAFLASPPVSMLFWACPLSFLFSVSFFPCENRR